MEPNAEILADLQYFIMKLHVGVRMPTSYSEPLKFRQLTTIPLKTQEQSNYDRAMKIVGSF